MFKNLFTNSVFGFVLLFIVGLDVINSMMSMITSFGTSPIIIVKIFSVLISFVALISFFVEHRYSLKIIKFYIFFRLIIFPTYFVLYGLKDVVLYSYNIISLETYVRLLLTIVIGIFIYYFFKKYRVKPHL